MNYFRLVLNNLHNFALFFLHKYTLKEKKTIKNISSIAIIKYVVVFIYIYEILRLKKTRYTTEIYLKFI